MTDWVAGPGFTVAHTVTVNAAGTVRTGCGRVLDTTPAAAPDGAPRCRLCERIHHGDAHHNRPHLPPRRQP